MTWVVSGFYSTALGKEQLGSPWNPNWIVLAEKPALAHEASAPGQSPGPAAPACDPRCRKAPAWGCHGCPAPPSMDSPLSREQSMEKFWKTTGHTKLFSASKIHSPQSSFYLFIFLVGMILSFSLIFKLFILYWRLPRSCLW